MRMLRWPKQWHRRIAAVITILGGLMGLSVMLEFRGGWTGDNTTGSLAVACITAAGVALLLVIGRHLDRTHPTSSFIEAAIRLLAPTLVVGLGSAWLMNRGIFARDQGTPITIAVLCGLTIAGAIALDRSWSSKSNARVEPNVIATPDPAPTTGVLGGPPQWPTAPPTEPPVSVPAGIPEANAPAIQGTATGSKAHRITSGIITAGWLPLGFIVWFAANWCPDEGTGDAVFAASTIYVVVQLVGNMFAGWFLDRRFGNRGGTTLAIGRSVLAAAVLMIAVGYFLTLFIPEGTSRYCG